MWEELSFRTDKLVKYMYQHTRTDSEDGETPLRQFGQLGRL